MKAAVSIPVTVKCRIGVDDQEPREALWAMVHAVRDAGADALVVHARKAWLKGLSPKENRDVPPLDYALVHALKRDFPNMPISINGGIRTMDETLEQLRHLDGVMVGREAYQNPGMLLDVDPLLFGEPAPVADSFEALAVYEPYIAARLAEGVKLSDMTRHMLGLFAGMPGARLWRRHLAMEGVKRGAGLETLHAALAHVDRSGERESAAA
jgi:tRNA-dihydrouridine synthase A